MSPTVAAIVLLWIVVLVLAFAMAGILQKVRDLERRGTSGPAAVPDTEAVDAVAPEEGQAVSAVLLVEEGCGVCAEVLPSFTAARSLSGSERVNFVVVTNSSDGTGYDIGDVQVLADPDIHARLEPGWFPAMLIVTPDRVIAAVEPAGSPEAVEDLVVRVTSRAAAAR